MRNEEGEEIVEPGDYSLSDDRRLRVYLTRDDDEQFHMWACTHCQEVNGTLNAILVAVIDGQMDLTQDADGEFRLKMTQAGIDRVESILGDLGDASESEDDA